MFDSGSCFRVKVIIAMAGVNSEVSEKLFSKLSLKAEEEDEEEEEVPPPEEEEEEEEEEEDEDEDEDEEDLIDPADAIKVRSHTVTTSGCFVKSRTLPLVILSNTSVPLKSLVLKRHYVIYKNV